MTETMTQLTPGNSAAVIAALRQALISGKSWYIALLEAIGQWNIAEETYNGRIYRYLIDGEAFDWLLLAERLCQAAADLLPPNEVIALLFYCRPPIELSASEFKSYIGAEKYRQYLNFFYGIIVEQALIMSTQNEVRKEKWALGLRSDHDLDEAYRRVYGARQAELLSRFRQEKNRPESDTTSLTELKEFTYWLFKYRLSHSEKAKVASDTRKGLNWLKKNNARLREPPADFIKLLASAEE